MSKQTVPFLRRGSAGEYVRVVQNVINLHHLPGINKLDPDGRFGPNTEAAVKAFQRRFQCVPDGIVGPITRAKLFPLGTYQGVIFVTSPSQPDDQSGVTLTDSAPARPTSSPSSDAPLKSPPVILFPQSTTFSLAPLASGGTLTPDSIPGLPSDLPFPDLPNSLPGFFPTPQPFLFPLKLPPLPPVFPNKIQLAPGNQVAVPKLTLLGPSPKQNPVVDTFVATVRGVWPVAHNRVLHDIEAGGTLGLPISQPISDRKNTTYQFFIQGVSPDLLIDQKLWFELHLIGKAGVTIPKDGSSTSAAVSAQVKASVKLDSAVSASIVAGPQLAGTVAGGKFSLSVTPIVVNAGITVSF